MVGFCFSSLLVVGESAAPLELVRDGGFLGTGGTFRGIVCTSAGAFDLLELTETLLVDVALPVLPLTAYLVLGPAEAEAGATFLPGVLRAGSNGGDLIVVGDVDRADPLTQSGCMVGVKGLEGLSGLGIMPFPGA